MEQRTPEWFKARIGKVTGSNIGAILGCDPYRKPKDVLRAMVRSHHGAESEFQGNIATRYGNQFESYAQADFELETGLSVEEVGLIIHPEHDWLAASPDGLTDDDGVLEIKCPYGKRESNDFLSYIDLPHYFSQMQIEMAVTGRKHCHFYQWSSKGSRVELVEFSQVWFDDKLPKLKEFYDLFLSEIDNEAHLTALVQTKEAQALADRYNQAKAKADEAKEEMEQAKKELISIADGNKTNVSGLLVYPIELKGSVSYAKAIKELLPDADLTPYTGKPSKSWGIR